MNARTTEIECATQPEAKTWRSIGELAEKIVDEIARDRIEGRDYLLPSDFPETEAK